MNRFTIRQRAGVTVLRADGPNLDAGAIREFLARLAEAAADAPQVVVDLTAVEFVDSSGLGALCGLTHSAPAAVRIAGVSGRLAQGLARVPGNHLPPCYETLDDAVAACGTVEACGAPAAARRGRRTAEVAGAAR